jgi:[protein-PII] uridylyltransferase
LDRVFTKFNHQYAGYESVLRKNEDPLLLYLILLLHDIGKAEGIKGHAENGVRIAKPILDRFHISDPQQEQILFIIGSHLEMARFWQRFDLDDPQTARSFASFIHTPDKLRFLFVHTFCDAHGTAPNLWNDYKNSMHHTLFNRTLEQLQDQDVLSAKGVGHKDKILDKVRSKLPEEISTEEVDAHFSLLPERYFLHTGVDELALHLQMIHQLLNQIQHSDSLGSLAPIINWRNDVDLNMTIVNVVTWDRAGLFYKLAGALSLAGVSISNTRAISRGDHISIDTFYVMDPQGGRVTQTRAKEVFESHLNDCLVHGKELLPSIMELEAQTQQQKPKEPQLAPFPPTVNVYHELSLKRTILEVQAVDRIGLLYRLAREVTHRGFNISFARVATERDIAMDTFYIENIQQNNDQKTNQLVELRSALEAVIQVEG